jgi:MFS transporter, DHA2 family, multidrug resistance protein
MSLQFVLEEGAKNDWFQDDHILLLALVAAICGPLFIWRSLQYRNPIVELRAFTNTNFRVGFFMTFVTGAMLFGGTFLLPLFLGRVSGYSSAEVGTTMVVSGVSMFIAAPIAGRLSRRLDPRILMFCGFLLAAYGMWSAHTVTPEWGFWEFAGVQAFRGVGVMIAMLASQNVTMSTLPPHMVKNASALVNLSRNVGGAFGLALLNTTLTERTAVHMGEIGARVTQGSPQATGMLDGLVARFESLGVADPQGAAYSAFHRMIQLQATDLAFGDAFALLALACVAAAVVTLFARPARVNPAAAAEAH